ncbi:MAG TPA: PACE efflux transporter [Hydrogenophaga sp.]|uniref:PACE efflux transporter n=1 Tax=Hydrogenophaga sp. TaxID=1904254 RepID=UPI002BA0A92D|nr:PACE efflux transporter [Hydrogenophaga sp.]HMN92783.1 PACE efflux transporter [Hydrogenophaga sp.]
MQGVRRKIVYVGFFELFAIAISTAGLAYFSDSSVGRASVAAVVSSAIAVVWNLMYNTVFERWEARQIVRGRSWKRRVAHAAGFEAGLILTLVPFFAWWLDISLWQAFVLDLGLIVFFLVYTFAFSWVFDRLFGLPASAR